MNLLIANLLVAVLAGLGLYAVIARRHAVMVLIGAELLVNAGLLLLVLSDLQHTGPGRPALFTGQIGALFGITIAAAEIGLALAIVLLAFRTRGDSDLRGLDSLGEHGPGAPELPGTLDRPASEEPASEEPATEGAADAVGEPAGAREGGR